MTKQRSLDQATTEPANSGQLVPFPEARQLPPGDSSSRGEQRDAGLDAEIRRVASALDALMHDVSGIFAIVCVLLGRFTDVSHMSIEEVARVKHVTEKTVRNWIADGKLTREIIPGTRKSGVPTGEVFSGWIEADRADEILQESRKRYGKS